MPGGPRRLALLPLLHALVGGEGAGPPGRGGSPSGVFSVADYGGRPGPAGNNTAAFGRAIAACSAAGGGVVDVPPGVWVSGGIRLGSHMVLRLRAGATIRGITPASPHDILTDYCGPVASGGAAPPNGVSARYCCQLPSWRAKGRDWVEQGWAGP